MSLVGIGVVVIGNLKEKERFEVFRVVDEMVDDEFVFGFLEEIENVFNKAKKFRKIQNDLLFAYCFEEEEAGHFLHKEEV